MKIIILGDIHGRNIWKEIVEKESDADLIIFNGDYFDSREGHSVHTQINNFIDLMEFAEQRKIDTNHDTIFHIGNHDLQYFEGIENESCWNANSSEKRDIRATLEKYRSRMQMASAIDEKTLVSHAGISKTFCRDNGILESWGAHKIATTINEMWLANPEVFRFNMGDNMDGSGDDICQTPVWIRIPSLLIDSLDGIDYIVGHTTHKEVTGYQTPTDGLIVAIDTLGTSKEYIRTVDNVLEPVTL